MKILDYFRKAKKQGRPYVPFHVEKTESGSYDRFISGLLSRSKILLITGKRGSGKTALGMKILELYRKKLRRKCYSIGFEKSKLPFWLKKAKTIEDIPNSSIALIDEGAVIFSSREPMKDSNKFLGKLMAVARHKGVTLVLIAQNSAMIDLNVLRLADTLLLKEPSLLQAKFERKAVKDMYDKITPLFKDKKHPEQYFYVWDDDFEGLLRSGLPEFWNESISTSFK